MNRQISGRIGEKLAIDYLRNRGYRVITANYAVNGGELDVVAYKSGVLVFAEVKAKSDTEKGEPSTEITGDKKAALYSAATQFIRLNCKNGKVKTRLFGVPVNRRVKSYRLDLIEVLADGQRPKRLIHTKNIIKNGESANVVQQHKR